MSRGLNSSKGSWNPEFVSMRRPCTAIPAYASRLMCLQPQPHEHNFWEIITDLLPHTQRDTLDTPEKHMKIPSRMEWCQRIEDKDFLLKIGQEYHKPKVDGNASVCTSTHKHAYQYYDAMCQTSNQGYWERKHMRSKRDKNSCTSYYHICINTDAFCIYTTNL